MLNKRSIQGFTLLEILIALFIFSILSIMLTQGLHLLISMQERTTVVADRLRSAQMALLILSRDVEQSINRPIINNKGMEEAAFIGTPRAFTLTHLGGAFGLLERVQYDIDGQVLYRNTWPVLDRAAESQTYKRSLLASISDAHFQYLDYKGQWRDHWPESEQNSDQKKGALPRAVKLFLSFSRWGALTQVYVIPFSPPPTQEKKEK